MIKGSKGGYGKKCQNINIALRRCVTILNYTHAVLVMPSVEKQHSHFTVVLDC